MKRLMTIFIALLLANAQAEKVYLVAIIGQSNAQGRGTVAEAVEQYSKINSESPSAYIWNREMGSFELFEFGKNQHLGNQGNAANFGAETELLKQFTDAGDKVYLVKFARGASNLVTQWNPDGGYYFSLFVTEYLKAAQTLEREGKEVVHAGILFSQGESDSKNLLAGGVDQYYQRNQQALVNELRDQLDQPELLVVLTEINCAPTQAAKFTHTEQVNTAKRQVALMTDGVETIDTTDYTYLPDGIHYDTDSQIKHGAAFYELIDTAN